MSIFRRRKPSGHHASRRTERIARIPLAPGMPGMAGAMYLPVLDDDEPHGVARPEVLAALKAKAEAQQGLWAGAPGPGLMQAAATLPFTLGPVQVQGAGRILAEVPVTEDEKFFYALGGDEKTARTCGYCKASQGRGDLSWRDDALGAWSCPSCQVLPEWRAPSLPGLRITTPEDHPGGEESGIMARTLLATNPRCVRERPDGTWMAAIPLGGRIRAVGPFATREEAEAAYGYVLGTFTQALAGEAA